MTFALKGPNLKAKANASRIIDQLIGVATNKSYTPNYKKKHIKSAKYGWYRYDVRFALPVYDNERNITRYNVYKARMLVRHDKDGKKYLYDFLNTKKETNSPLK